MKNNYDVIIAGAGRSGIKSLLELYKSLHEQLLKAGLNKSSDKKEINICIAHDKSEVGGPAYNPKQSPSPFSIHQSIHIMEQYIPDGCEKTDFEAWLDVDENIKFALEYVESQITDPNNPMPEANKKWLADYRVNLENHQYGQIPIPRAIYGIYLKWVLEKTIKDFAKLEEEFNVKVNIDAIHTKLEIQGKNDDGSFSFVVGENPTTLALNGEEEKAIESPPEVISGDKVVFGPGLMPNPLHKNAKDSPNYFGYNYDDDGSMLLMRKSIEAKWEEKNKGKSPEEQKPVEIIIAGSNSSAHEIIWLIHNAGLADKVHIHMISSNPKSRSASYDKGGEFILDEATKLEISQLKEAEEVEDFVKSKLASHGVLVDDEGNWNEDKSTYSRSEIATVLWPAVKTHIDEKFSLEERQSFYTNAFWAVHRTYAVFELREIVEAWDDMDRKGVITYHSGNIFDHDKVIANKNGVSCEYKDVVKENGVKYLTSNEPKTVEGDFFINCISGLSRFDQNNNENNYYRLLEKTLNADLNAPKTGLLLSKDAQMMNTKKEVIEGFYPIGYSVTDSYDPQNGATHALSGGGFVLDTDAQFIARQIVKSIVQDKIVSKTESPASEIKPQSISQCTATEEQFNLR